MIEVNEQCKGCFHFQVCANVLKQQLFIREKMLKEEKPKCENYIPTADVVEVKRGKWALDSTRTREDGDTYDYCCSLCGGEAHEGEYGNHDVLADFCHHCGADMRPSEEK